GCTCTPSTATRRRSTCSTPPDSCPPRRRNSCDLSLRDDPRLPAHRPAPRAQEGPRVLLGGTLERGRARVGRRRPAPRPAHPTARAGPDAGRGDPGRLLVL